MKNLALLLISICFALVLGEIALRIMGWGPSYVSPERIQFWKEHSLLGWAHQPGQEGVFENPQFRTFVRINQKGLRDREHSYERPNNTKRILVLGDSFAWGFGVDESDRFSELLETSLGVDVVNAGVSGYSTDQELLWLKSEGIKYDADLVILIFCGNDIIHNHMELVYTIYYKPKFIIEEGKTILKSSRVPTIGLKAKFIYFLSQHSALANLFVDRYFNLLSFYKKFKDNLHKTNPSVFRTSPTKKSFELTIILLDEMNNIAKLKGAKFMIVATDRWWHSPSGETYQDFIDTLKASGFLVLDVESMPGFNPTDMLIPHDGHWSIAGHQFVAEQIENFIESHRLLSEPHNYNAANRTE